MTRHRLGELAAAVGGEVVGDPDRLIERVAPLDRATARDLSFVTHPRYRQAARESAAGALLVSAKERELGLEVDLIVCDDPYLGLARVLGLFHPPHRYEPGIHPTAVIGPDCEIAASAHVGPYAVIGEGSTVGESGVIGSHCVVGRRCRVGSEVVLHPHVVLYDRVEIAERSVVHSGTVLGADGFGFAGSEEGQLKVPQVGQVLIAEDVEIGANSAVDRATLDATRIGRGTKIDNLVQVGHNAQLGEGCILCGQVGISGSAKIGDRVVFAGQTGAAGHLEIGDGVQVAGKSAVLSSVGPGVAVGGVPAMPLKEWRRQVAALRRLPEMKKRLDRLERRLQAELEGEGPSTAPDGASSSSKREGA